MKQLTPRHCLIVVFGWLAALTAGVLAQSPGQSSEPIPVSELGAKAGAQYHGDGLSVAPTPEGARLRCLFQKLEGQVTREGQGLWLTSTVEPQTGERFRVVASALGRAGALAVSGRDLYAGGGFTIAGGNSAMYVAKWDGSAWSALGSGVNRWVYALAVSGSNLYVGGHFTTAGDKVSTYLAQANLGGAATVVPVFTSIVPNPSGTQVLLTFTSDPGASFHLLSSTSLTTWQTNSTVNATGVTNSVPVSITQAQEFFRLRRQP